MREHTKHTEKNHRPELNYLCGPFTKKYPCKRRGQSRSSWWQWQSHVMCSMGLSYASTCLSNWGIFHNPLQQKQRSQITQSRGSCQCQTDSRLDLEDFSLSTFIWKRLVINLELVPFSLRIWSWSLIFANPFIISVLIIFRLSTFLWISQQFCLCQGVLKNFCKWSW